VPTAGARMRPDARVDIISWPRWNVAAETAVGSHRGKQRYALAAALAQLEAAEMTCSAIVNGAVFSESQAPQLQASLLLCEMIGQFMCEG